MSALREGSEAPLFRIVLADDELRAEVRERYGEELASDACAVVYCLERMLGWGDDYGTFHVLPGLEIGLKAINAVEDLLENVSDLVGLGV